MDFTGRLYGFYSNRPISKVFVDIKAYAKSINFKFNCGAFEEYEHLFFYKDKIMLQHHEDKGYNTELGGEGCFYLEAKIATLDGIATLFEFEGESNFQPMDINLAFSKSNYYVLTIPHFKDDDIFSKKIHDTLRNILMKE